MVVRRSASHPVPVIRRQELLADRWLKHFSHCCVPPVCACAPQYAPHVLSGLRSPSEKLPHQPGRGIGKETSGQWAIESSRIEGDDQSAPTNRICPPVCSVAKRSVAAAGPGCYAPRLPHAAQGEAKGDVERPRRAEPVLVPDIWAMRASRDTAPFRQPECQDDATGRGLEPTVTRVRVMSVTVALVPSRWPWRGSWEPLDDDRVVEGEGVQYASCRRRDARRPDSVQVLEVGVRFMHGCRTGPGPPAYGAVSWRYRSETVAAAPPCGTAACGFPRFRLSSGDIAVFADSRDRPTRALMTPARTAWPGSTHTAGVSVAYLYRVDRARATNLEVNR